MNKTKSYPLFRAIRWLVKVFYPKIEVSGAENLPDESAVIVGNHSQMNGPIACELYFPKNSYTWCAGQMMKLREVPAYAFQDFWSGKPEYIRWFYKLLSYIIAPLSVCIFNNANTIGVYHDTRIISTFKQSMSKLCEGANIIIFPEHNEDYNNIICNFQDRFIDIAKLYYKKTGIELKFVPMYIAPELKTMYFGKPVRFCSSNSIEDERRRICDYLMKEITNIACSLPEHTVVPYRNISRKYYKSNLSKEAENEKTSR